MGKKSTLRRLPPEILKEINQLLSEGRLTLDELVAYLHERGVEGVTRSALGRQKQKIDKVAAKLRQSREITSALVKELGEDSTAGEQGRLLVETLRGMVYDHLQERIDKGESVDPKNLMTLARAMKDMAQATRMSQDYELKIREEARREMEAEIRTKVRKLGTAQELKELSDAELERRIAELTATGA